MVAMAVRVVQKFASFAESARAEREYHASLSPQQRLDLLLELIARQQEEQDEAVQRCARVRLLAQLPRR